MIVFYGVDMEAMATFLGTPEFAERTVHFVSGHTVYSISELSRSPTFPLLTTKPACTAL